MRLLLVGMNHTTAPVEVRERFAVNEVAPVLQKLADAEEIEEVAIISTCNRVEVVATTRQPEPARLLLADFFTDQGGALPEHLYRYRDREVVRHLFRVASAMDSMVVGEPQILGQLKDAYRDAVEATTCGPVLSRLFQHGFKVAKRVKNETRISERPVSVAKVAVDLTRQIFEQLDDKSRITVIPYDDAAKPIVTTKGLERASPALVKKIARRIRTLSPGGKTNIYDGLWRAFHPGRTPDPKDVTKGPDTIFLLTDGSPSAGQIVSRLELRDAVLRWNIGRMIRVHAINVGTADNDWLRNLTGQTGGQFLDLTSDPAPKKENNR